MTPLDFRNTNTLWCSVLVETLVRRGMTHAVVSPGSRSTPLTMALVRHPGIEAVPVLDERSAAFFALGLAKQTQRPVVLVCTSGTAGANYFPAVIEAHESGVPLIVITADRPPEMRDCASGQTIDQQKLFGGFVEFYHELAVPEATLPLLRYLRQTVAHAVERAARGPVHLNAPFRDPLPPIEDATAKALETQDWRVFFAAPEVSPRGLVRLAAPMDGSSPKRAVVIAGNDWSHESIDRLFAKSGWPVLADALSSARMRTGGGVVVAAYDAILRDPRAAAALKPELVVILGELPTSKTLRAWLTSIDVETVYLTGRTGNRDSLHGRTRVRVVDADEVDALPFAMTPAEPAWSAAWMRAEAAAQAILASAGNEQGFEGGFTRAIAETLTKDQTIFVASSMPVRDLEYFAPVRSDGPRVLANRGANGIDGTLSTALGVAHAGAATVLLTGDLALLHDTNGFLVTAKLKGSLTVVLINNDGGGIFGHLPVAKFNPPFEEYWATPQRVDFARLCAAYNVPYERIDTPATLAERLCSQVGVSGVRVIEVRTDRNKDVATRQRLFAAAAKAAGDVVG